MYVCSLDSTSEYHYRCMEVCRRRLSSKSVVVRYRQVCSCVAVCFAYASHAMEQIQRGTIHPKKIITVVVVVSIVNRNILHKMFDQKTLTISVISQRSDETADNAASLSYIITVISIGKHVNYMYIYILCSACIVLSLALVCNWGTSAVVAARWIPVARSVSQKSMFSQLYIYVQISKMDWNTVHGSLSGLLIISSASV